MQRAAKAEHIGPRGNDLAHIAERVLGTALAVMLAAQGPALADSSDFEKAGDVLQYALPLAAGYCAVQQHREKEFATGFVVQTAIVQGLKYGLGDAGINQRPNGEGHGFPSGHTATAFYGATNLARKCFKDKPVLGAIAYGAAVAVGLSRIAADKHDPLQVGVGAVIGVFSNGITVSAEKGRIGLGYSLNF